MVILSTWMIMALVIGAMFIHLMSLVGESIFLSFVQNKLMGKYFREGKAEMDVVSKEQERRKRRD
ncbi:hypothetical protein [Cytobacillus purgationiresistens]|uniref:Uncharacterized protein n=1 Tax=Cytobacillus purgationiresistens TaxID=863449 RepID=A0ABU0AGF4_9BACI|nr:hypothetical protein [Cytobacillus purgationiresistens]MDQ0270339.1 hypothetical protein [Cytobacillus purgationiresistens]